MSETLWVLGGLRTWLGVVVAREAGDLRVPTGMITALVGPSGAGKTTLLKIADLLLEPDAGEVRFAGRRVRVRGNGNGNGLKARRQMGMVRQKPVVFNSSVASNVALGLGYRGVPSEEQGQRVDEALRMVELTRAKERHAPRLSGGQAQRVAFARAVVMEPRLLLLDEFTANLDPRNVTILERAVKAYIAKEPGERGALIVTHNIFQARRLCEKVAVIVDGRIVEAGPCRRLFGNARTEEARSFLEGEMVW